MATTSESKLSMKLLIDTGARKVLFAEAEKDCVDFLFNVLSLHVGTVIRLLKEKGMNYGCLPNLYDSVENLNDCYILPNKNKEILLKPKCSIGISSVPFLHNDVPTTKTFYGCASFCCSTYFTDDAGTLCPHCKSFKMTRTMYYAAPDTKEAVATKGGFVKEPATYMVMDDLVVKPLSTNSINQLFLQSNVNGAGVLQEQEVKFGMEEALKLLKASFETKAVLTNVFMSRVKVEK